MQQNHNAREKSQILYLIIASLIAILILFGTSPQLANAQDVDPELISTEYSMTELMILPDGSEIYKTTISSPPQRPAGYFVDQLDPMDLSTDATAVMLTGVPAFQWVFGCSAVSAAMISGYYDGHGFPNMYTGLTNGGVVPLTDSVWGTWSDGTDIYPNNPLIASKLGVDGRTSRGSIDDYWILYGSNSIDPYITGGWAQHAGGDSVGDYMKTSQSAYDNTDGSTAFYHYNDATPLTCEVIEAYNLEEDGTWGFSQFFTARGYAVNDCYYQNTSNVSTGGFSLAQYRAAIDSGNPVMIHVVNHTMVGVGYDSDSSLIYIHDTWDNNVHSMTWGGSYFGLSMQAVSIVNPIIPTAVELLDFSATAKKSAVLLSWETASELNTLGFNVYRAKSPDGKRKLLNSELIGSLTSPGSLTGAAYSFKDRTAKPGIAYYYWLEEVNVYNGSELFGPEKAKIKIR